MGNEDFDEIPGDMDAEDFANFDPDRYRGRRDRGSLNRPRSDDLADNLDRSSAPDDDFANFDPSAYLRKRRGQAGRLLTGQTQPSAETRYRSRRRSSVLDDDDDLPSAGDTVGLGAGLLGGLFSGQMPGDFADILRQASPLLRVGLLALGCGILALLAVGCVVGYLLVTALSNR